MTYAGSGTSTLLAPLVAALLDLRKRLLFVVQMFAVYMVALHIPLPGIDRDKMNQLFSSGGLLSMLDIFFPAAHLQIYHLGHVDHVY